MGFGVGTVCTGRGATPAPVTLLCTALYSTLLQEGQAAPFSLVLAEPLGKATQTFCASVKFPHLVRVPGTEAGVLQLSQDSAPGCMQSLMWTLTLHLPVQRDHFYRHTLRTQLRGKEFPTKPMQGLVEPVLDFSAGSPQKKFPTCSLFPGGQNPPSCPIPPTPGQEPPLS